MLLLLFLTVIAPALGQTCVPVPQGILPIPDSENVAHGISIDTFDPLPVNSDVIWNSFRAEVFDFGLSNCSCQGACVDLQKASHPLLLEASCDEFRIDAVSFSNTTTLEQLSEEFTSTAKSQVGFPKGSFSKSASVQRLQKESFEENQVVYRTATDISVWKILFDPLSPLTAPLAAFFKNDVMNVLPLSYNPKDPSDPYNSFIRTYGHMYGTAFKFGGRAEQSFTLSRVSEEELTSQGVKVDAAAKAVFKVSVGLTKTYDYDQKKVEAFLNVTAEGSVACIGGEPQVSCRNVTAWAATVPGSPAFVEAYFGDYIANLLNPNYFPNQSNIATKRELLLNATRQSLNVSLTCWKDCSNHGKCRPDKTNPFGIGVCECETGYSGAYCQEQVKMMPGMLCGMYVRCYDYHYKSDSCPCCPDFGIPCDGHQIYPDMKCPPGYALATSGHHGDQTFTYFYWCLKTDSSNYTAPGTLCGYSDSQSSINFRCANHDPASEGCPSGFSRREFSAGWEHFTTCVQTAAKSPLVPGMMCGGRDGVQHGPDNGLCGQFAPDYGRCPPLYSPGHAFDAMVTCYADTTQRP